MSYSRVAARVAVGASVLACAGVLAAGQLSASSAPPGTDDTATEASAAPGVSTPPSRQDIVAAVIASADGASVPIDQDCVTGVIDQVPDDQLGTVMQQVSLSGDVAMSDAAEVVSITMPAVSMPDLSKISMPDIEAADVSLPDLSAISIPDFSIPDFTLPDLTIPEISESANAALATQLISCVQGTSSPDLVDQVVTLISQQPDSGLDLDCASHVLSTLGDQTLQFIVDNADVLSQDPTVTFPGDSIPEQAYLMVGCETGSVTAVTAAAAPAAPVVTVAATPTTSA